METTERISRSKKQTFHVSIKTQEQAGKIEKYLKTQSTNSDNINHSNTYALVIDAFYRLFIQNNSFSYEKRLENLLNQKVNLSKEGYSKISRTLDIVDPVYYLLVVSLQKQFDVAWQLKGNLPLEEQISPEVKQILELVFTQIKADRVRGKTIKESHKGR